MNYETFRAYSITIFFHNLAKFEYIKRDSLKAYQYLKRKQNCVIMQVVIKNQHCVILTNEFANLGIQLFDFLLFNFFCNYENRSRT